MVSNQANIAETLVDMTQNAFVDNSRVDFSSSNMAVNPMLASMMQMMQGGGMGMDPMSLMGEFPRTSSYSQ